MGTSVPYQVSTPPPANSDFSQPPQLTSLSISSNNSLNLFFGSNSTISISFGVNQTVSNMQATIDGQQTFVDQGSNGTYSISYKMTGNETLPLQVVISYTNPSGLIGQTYFSIGNNAPVSTASNTTTIINPAACPANLTCVPNASTATTAPSASASSYSFSNYLYSGMTKLNVSNPDVTALQERLLKDGFFSGPITGYFGPVTKAAVQAYQKAHSLDAIGVVGPGTRKLLNQGI